MFAAWMRAMSDLRARWRGALVLALMFGIAGGIIMATATGARRSTTSFARLLETSKAYDVEVQPVGSEDDEKLLDEIAKLPQVAAHGRLSFVPATEAIPGRKPDGFSWDVSAVALGDRNLARTIEIPKLIDGRAPALDDASEAAASPRFMRSHGLKVGDSFSIQTVTFDELLQLFGGSSLVPTGPVVTVRITGVWQVPHDVAIGEPEGFVFLTPAFNEAYQDRIAMLATIFVRLEHGLEDFPAFAKAAREIGGVESLDIRDQSELIDKVDRVLGVQSTALWILALAVGVAAVLVLGQALGRWLSVGADDRHVLRALGMGRSQRVAVAALPAIVIGIAASVVAVVAALPTARFALFGLARDVEPGSGPFVDVTVLAAGAAGVLLLVAIRGGVQGLILARRDLAAADIAATPTAGDRIARRGLSPTISTGLRFAFEPGRGGRAVPVRSVLAGSMLAIAVVVGAFIFGHSLDRLLATPSAYGWNWDLIGFGGEDPELTAEKERRLAETPLIAGFSRVISKVVTLERNDIEAIGVTPVEGSVYPRVLDGVFPAGDDEVALATATLRREGLDVGDVVTFRGTAEACGGTAGCPLRYRIVGRIIHWSEGSDPDDGAAFTGAGQSRVQGSEGFADFFIRVQQGVDLREAERAVNAAIGDSTSPQLPANLQNIETVGSIPFVLAGILAAICLATLLHGLVVCIRRRGRDLAVLKTLGFVRRQVRAAVGWQATAMIGLALAIGVPVGLVLGRWAWTLLAERLGVEVLHPVPPLWLTAGAIALLAAANLVAVVPARIAERARPALVLRTE